MSSEELRRTLQNAELTDAARSLELRKNIVSLYKQVDPDECSTPDIDFEDILKLKEYLIASRDRHVLNELLALLRNFVPFNSALRASLFRSDLNESLRELVFGSSLTEDADPDTVMTDHRFLQYAANSVAIDETTSEYFFRLLILSREGAAAVRRIFQGRNEKLVRVAMTLLIRMLQSESNWLAFLESEELIIELTSELIGEVLKTSDPDAFALLKRIATSPGLFSVYFDKFDVQSQSFLLDLVCEQLTEASPDRPVMTLPDESRHFCIKRAKEYIERLRKQRDRDVKEAGEALFVKFITVLALLSLEDHRGIISDDLELLIMSIECLRSVHILGKEDASGYEPMSDFESLAGNKDEIFEHPSFGLKRDLVRLIGNMCYKSKRNQDTMRDFNGIELLCDMSSLDARNPFITQWVVLALKNLMDDNEENQKVVASLTKKKDS